ncbi:hypothetical protein SAMN05444365_1011122 [Micromonospora pattaloongensis]|uniref:Uncharacterized protein n=1 Tax=Micromonospora pattaloongensis TaxID=405436 RepID=A0A1H3I4P0_9ACTN|nr:hypothetical protein [Micromonospora pattaloongensis]SDY22640.1 hypothetical protein SAMN05444365_1011122 [Micromonospora pattaloongensis]
MAARKRPAAPSRDQRVVGWIKGVGIALGALLLVGFCLLGAFSDDDSTVVPAPTETERRDTVAVLERSADAQDVCYGWRLQDGEGDIVSVGSNLGDNVAVATNPARCPRWVEVVATVTYTSESSESEDWASVQVESADPLWQGAFTAGLERLGLDNDAFLDEPGWAICRAAVALPLLTAEAGHAEPAPVATGTPTAQPSPLPEAGSDFARDRSPYLVGAFLLFVVTAVLVTIGWFQRRHELAAVRPPSVERTRKPKAGQRR